MSDESDAFLLRLEAYLCERTGLPRATVQLFMDAQAQFYAEHAGNLPTAKELAEDLLEE